MTCATTVDTGLEQAYARGTIFALLANVLRYPDEELCARLDEPLRWVSLRRISARLGAPLPDLLSKLEDSFTALCAETQPQDALDRLREDYELLFGHTARGRCPGYELEYGTRDIIQQSPQLADISGFYSAFGLQVSEASQERIDHVSVQCEFMSVLCDREASAFESGNVEGCGIVLDAQRAFLTDHLGRWGLTFARRVCDAAGGAFYGATAELLCEFLRGECQRAGAPVGPTFIELCDADPEKDVEFSCGVEETAPGGSDHFVQLGIDR